MKQLVELHGGPVQRRERGRRAAAPRSGCELPLAAVREADAAERVHPRAEPLEPVPGDLPRLDGLHILLVDDQPDAAEAIAHVLTSAGASVTSVGSADEALAALERQRRT